MAKILISPLGTGRFSLSKTEKREYNQVKYKFHDNDSEYVTSFISAALSNHIVFKGF
ncbi:hypothetical protein [Bacillus sp. FJAT-47783]|uniref:hypothetical protein n=1 Tax=Bacillus sp. FJAT-47783 TaxID=2922712 RepID=UPI001FADAF6C|nr:hypothetical protein [Bacillus sp. FJAT-47783]